MSDSHAEIIGRCISVVLVTALAAVFILLFAMYWG